MNQKNESKVKGETKDTSARLDTRPIPVADGWAGAKMHVFTFSNSITMTDGPTDQQTDGQTDGQTDVRMDGRTDGGTKPLIELRVRN